MVEREKNIDFFMTEILSALEEEVLSSSEIAEKLKVHPGTHDYASFSTAFELLEETCQMHGYPKREPLIELCIDKKTQDFRRRFKYYRISDEEELVNQGKLSREFREYKGISDLDSYLVARALGDSLR